MSVCVNVCLWLTKYNPSNINFGVVCASDMRVTQYQTEGAWVLVRRLYLSVCIITPIPHSLTFQHGKKKLLGPKYLVFFMNLLFLLSLLHWVTANRNRSMRTREYFIVALTKLLNFHVLNIDLKNHKIKFFQL